MDGDTIPMLEVQLQTLGFFTAISLLLQIAIAQPFFIVTWVETGLALILLSARCYTSWKIVRYTGPDLILAVITFIFGMASMAMITVGAAYGVGTPSATLTYNDDRNALLFGWTSQAVSLIAIGLGKVALVVFIEHLQEYETKSKRAFLWFIAGSNFIVNMIAAILVFLQCSPAKKLWDEQIPGRCPGRKRVQIFGYIQAPYSAFCDFALAVYPVLIFRKVQAFSLRQKIGLSVLMGLGIVAGACTIVKTVKLKLLTKVEDTTYTLGELILWNQTEMWVVFMVSCIPPTTAFFRFAYRKGASGVSSFLLRIRSSDEV